MTSQAPLQELEAGATEDGLGIIPPACFTWSGSEECAGSGCCASGGELLERPFAHALETGGMRCVYLRGREKILKRLLIHVAGLNLGLLMRKCFGVGTPRSLQGQAAALASRFSAFWRVGAVRAVAERRIVIFPLGVPLFLPVRGRTRTGARGAPAPHNERAFSTDC